MGTGQTPKRRGLALGRVEKLAFQGLLARQRAIERESQELQSDHTELLIEIEERLGLDDGALTGMPPTHQIDHGSWNIVEIEWEKPREPSENGTATIRTHTAADKIAVELGLVLNDGMNVKQKVAAIEAHRLETAAAEA